MHLAKFVLGLLFGISLLACGVYLRLSPLPLLPIPHYVYVKDAQSLILSTMGLIVIVLSYAFSKFVGFSPTKRQDKC
jgi:hypothetical protein